MKRCYILLAAGNSRRFGENKLFYPIDGKPMYQYGLEALRGAADDEVAIAVVTQYERLEVEVHAYDSSVTVLQNAHPEYGISHSMQIGLQFAAAQACEYALFLVADQPYLQKETIANFVRNFLKSQKTLGCVCAQGRTGNPVIFGKAYWKELMELRGDRGGKAVLKRHLEEAFVYEVLAKQLEDIDEKQAFGDSSAQELETVTRKPRN